MILVKAKNVCIPHVNRSQGLGKRKIIRNQECAQECSKQGAEFDIETLNLNRTKNARILMIHIFPREYCFQFP
jgi:hypothetical protein